MPRRAKDELFSRCRSATTSVRLAASHSAPAGSSTAAVPAMATRASAMPGSSCGGELRDDFSAGCVCKLKILAHGFTDQLFRRIRQNLGLRLAEYRLAADLHHQRDGERRDALQPLMHDSLLHAREHFAQPADVEESRRGVGAGRLQQD